MKKSEAPRTEDILFEIGTEELPATLLADILESQKDFFESRLSKGFQERRLSFKALRVFMTPRRLVFLIESVPGLQSVKENCVKGPSKQDAYSSDGKPTEKLLGFIKAKGAKLADIGIAETQGKDYIFLKISEPVEKTVSILPQIFNEFVRSISFSKNMRWDDSGLLFPRPIRHFLCFYGKKSVSFKIGNLSARNQTSVFSKGQRKFYSVKDIPSYFSLLKKQGVILDALERKQRIQKELEKLAVSFKGCLVNDPLLLSEVNFLVENPQTLAAPFHEEFLKLPLEVLTVSMARKQRIFGVLDKQGRVLPRFLGVADGRISAAEKKQISKNYEHILHAKLKDSLFFYEEDVKLSLDKRRNDLKGLIFLKSAGSMLEKSERLAALAKTLGPEIGLNAEDQKDLEKAASICKADLLTQMVGEFPELQGVMGRYYTEAGGEGKAVSLAVGEHYLPRTASDSLPETLPGAVLSIIDKCDLLTASFSLGLQPSSSLDPYGLRRSAVGVVKIILDKKINISIRRLVLLCRDQLGAYASKSDEAALLTKLLPFFEDRLKAVLVDRGYREDVLGAVFAGGFDPMNESFERLKCLTPLVKEDSFLKAWKVVERTTNILKSQKGPVSKEVNPAVFADALEHEVFKQYQGVCEPVKQAAQARNFRLATSLYAEAFFDILEKFFAEVFVNAEDPAVRANRLALLRSVRELYTEKIADLSKINLLTQPS